jgi:iron uptake system EfeUOB component EfeO/EfeM
MMISLKTGAGMLRSMGIYISTQLFNLHIQCYSVTAHVLAFYLQAVKLYERFDPLSELFGVLDPLYMRAEYVDAKGGKEVANYALD